MALTATLVTRFDNFFEQVKKAEVALADFGMGTKTLNDKLGRLQSAFAGDRIVSQAFLTAQAIEAVGGASTLTEKEAKRAFGVMTEAIEKLQARGAAVPPELRKMADETAAAAGAASTFSGRVQQAGDSLAKLASGVALGNLAADAVKAMGREAVEAGRYLVGMVTGAIDAGSKLFDLSNKTGISVERLSAFKFIAQQTGGDLETMTGAVFKLSATLGAMGADSKKAEEGAKALGLSLNDLRAMSPDEAFVRILDGLHAIPNAADRAGIGTALFGRTWKEVSNLAQEDIRGMIAEAERMGIVMSTETAAAADAAGDAIDAFGAQIEGAKTRLVAAFLPAIIGVTADLRTLFSAAAKEAGSAVNGLGGTLQLVRDAMGTGSTAIEAQARLYEVLRGAIISVVRGGVEPLVTAFGYLMVGADAFGVVLFDLHQALDVLYYGFKRAALGAAELLAFAGLKSATQDVERIKKELDGIADRIMRRSELIQGLKKSEGEWADSASAANKAIEAGLKAVEASHFDVNAAIAAGAAMSRAAAQTQASDIERVDEATKKHADEIAKLVDKYTALNADAKNLTEALARIGDVSALSHEQQKMLAKDVAELVAQYKALGQEAPAHVRRIYEETLRLVTIPDLLKKANAEAGASIAKMADAVVDKQNKTLDAALKASGKIGDEFVKATGTAKDVALAQAEEWRSKSLTAIEPLRTQIPEVYEEAKREVKVVYDQMVQDAKNSVQKQAGAFSRLSDDVASAITGALRGGGKVGASVGDAIGKNLFSSDGPIGGPLMKASSKLSASVGGQFGELLGGTLGKAIPFVGSMVGPAIGALAGKLFGAFSKSAEKEVNKTRQAFIDAAGGLGALNEQASAAGVTLTAMLNAKTPEAYKKAIDDLNAAFKFQDDAMKTLDETVKKYGFSLEELGPAFARQELDKKAQELFQDFTVLAAAGVPVENILGKMGDSVERFIQQALRTGTEVPEQMRPMLDKMIELGQLTDANGNVITDLKDSGIVFSESMTTGFAKVVSAVEKLGDAIARALGITKQLDGTTVDVTVRRKWEDVGDPGGTEPPPFALGTKGVTGGWFKNFGAGTQAVLHGNEAVVRADQAGEFAAAAGFGGDASAVEELRGLRAELMAMPLHISRAVRDAVLLAG